MLIQMTGTRRGSEDGFAVKCYENGKQYDVADTLARRFVTQGYATEVEFKGAINTGMSCQYV